MGVLVFCKKPLFAWVCVSLPSVNFTLNFILGNHQEVAEKLKHIHWSLISGHYKMQHVTKKRELCFLLCKYFLFSLIASTVRCVIKVTHFPVIVSS